MKKLRRQMRTQLTLCRLFTEILQQEMFYSTVTQWRKFLILEWRKTCTLKVTTNSEVRYISRVYERFCKMHAYLSQARCVFITTEISTGKGIHFMQHYRKCKRTFSLLPHLTNDVKGFATIFFNRIRILSK